MGTSKINLLYYKHIVDRAIERFANDFEHEFSRDDGLYVLSRFTERKYKRAFREYIKEDIIDLTSEFNILSPNYYFIIGSCYPRDNILLNHVREEKINRNFKGIQKYFLIEEDIVIDNEKFNVMFDDIFDEIMIGKSKIENRERNVFMIKNPRSDCYTTYRIIKDIYGKTNTVNLKKIKSDEFKPHFISVNELIDKEITGIKNIIRSDEMEPIRKEIEQLIKLDITGEI